MSREPHRSKAKSPGGVWKILTFIFLGTLGFLLYQIYLQLQPLQKSVQTVPAVEEPKPTAVEKPKPIEVVESVPDPIPPSQPMGPPAPSHILTKLSGKNSTERLYLAPIDFGYFRGGYIVLPIHRSVKLQWQASRDQQAYEKYHLLFSRYPDFRANFGSDTFENITEIKLRRFPLGYMYWKVRAFNKFTNQWTQFSEPVKLEIYTEVPGQNPTETKITENKYQSKSAHIAWAPLPRVTSYEIRYGPERNNLNQRVVTKQARYDLKLGQKEQVYWKIRSLNELGQPMSDFSKVHNAIKANAQQIFAGNDQNSPRSIAMSQSGRNILSPTEPLLPRIDSVIFSRTKKNKRPLKFRWAPVRGAQNYQLQLASNPQFHFTLFTDTTSKTRHVFRERLELGQYFWRVRYQKNNKWSPWSKVASFTVEQKIPY